jgi:hypothetical protein
MSSTDTMSFINSGEVPMTETQPTMKHQPSSSFGSSDNSVSVSGKSKNKKRKSITDDEEEENEAAREDESPKKRSNNGLQTGPVYDSDPDTIDLRDIARDGVRRAFREGCLPTMLMNGPLIVIGDTNSAAVEEGEHVWPFWTATHCLPGKTSMTTPGSRCGFGIVYQSLDPVDGHKPWWQDSFIDRSEGPASPVQASVLAILNALKMVLDQYQRISNPDQKRSTRFPRLDTITVFADSEKALERINASWYDRSMHFPDKRSALGSLPRLVRTIRSFGALGVKVQLCTTHNTREDPPNRWARKAARRALKPWSWTERPAAASVQHVCRRTYTVKVHHWQDSVAGTPKEQKRPEPTLDRSGEL